MLWCSNSLGLVLIAHAAYSSSASCSPAPARTSVNRAREDGRSLVDLVACLAPLLDLVAAPVHQRPDHGQRGLLVPTVEQHRQLAGVMDSMSGNDQGIGRPDDISDAASHQFRDARIAPRSQGLAPAETCRGLSRRVELMKTTGPGRPSVSRPDDPRGRLHPASRPAESSRSIRYQRSFNETVRFFIQKARIDRASLPAREIILAERGSRPSRELRRLQEARPGRRAPPRDRDGPK